MHIEINIDWNDIPLWDNKNASWILLHNINSPPLRGAINIRSNRVKILHQPLIPNPLLAIHIDSVLTRLKILDNKLKTNNKLHGRDNKDSVIPSKFMYLSWNRTNNCFIESYEYQIEIKITSFRISDYWKINFKIIWLFF